MQILTSARVCVYVCVCVCVCVCVWLEAAVRSLPEIPECRRKVVSGPWIRLRAPSCKLGRTGSRNNTSRPGRDIQFSQQTWVSGSRQCVARVAQTSRDTAHTHTHTQKSPCVYFFLVLNVLYKKCYFSVQYLGLPSKTERDSVAKVTSLWSVKEGKSQYKTSQNHFTSWGRLQFKNSDSEIHYFCREV